LIDMRYFSGFSLNGEQELFRDFKLMESLQLLVLAMVQSGVFEYALDALEKGKIGWYSSQPGLFSKHIGVEPNY